jgi:hypothetical protein
MHIQVEDLKTQISEAARNGNVSTEQSEETGSSSSSSTPTSESISKVAQANDISSLVKSKKQVTETAPAAKRKAEEHPFVEENGKKMRTEDGSETPSTEDV